MSVGASTLCVLLLAGAPYVDTKGRFELDLPTGWRLLPAYGDTFGMRFQRELAGGRVSLTIHVDPVETEGLEAFVAEIEGWVLEQGLERRGRTKDKVGALDAVAIDFASAKSKDDKTATRARSYFVEDRGHRYHLHVSATPPHVYARASRELRTLLSSFRSRVASRAEPPPPVPELNSIVGAWRNDSGLVFQLEPNGHFRLGTAEGRYIQSGETLRLMIDGKSPQTFRVERQDRRLLLHSDRLPKPAVYLRVDPSEAVRISSPLVGRWRATIPGGTLELLLEASGRFNLESHRGRWIHDAGVLSLTTDGGEVIAYATELAGERLSLSGGDLEEPLWLQKISAE